MLSGKKLKIYRTMKGLSQTDLARSLEAGGFSAEKARSAIKNWERGNMVPVPKTADVNNLAKALDMTRIDLIIWPAYHRFAPIAPRKAQLVIDLIRGRTVQQALDLLKFANKRAAVYVDKVLRSAIANADENEAEVEQLYVCAANVDYAGIRLNTKRWRAKDRGRAVSWIKKASHIHVAVDMLR